jgi:transposase InsO family protein
LNRLTPTQATWPTAHDLAGLPGLPGTDRGVRKRAVAEGWPFVAETTRGGWLLRYDPAILPTPARLALAARIVNAEDATGVSVPLVSNVTFVVDDSPARPLRETEAARMRILVLFQRWWQQIGGKLHPALQHFALLWTAGQIEAPPQLRVAHPKLTASTLRNWWLALQDKGTLARKNHPKRGQFTALSGEVGTAALSILASRPHLSATAVRTLLLKHGMVPAELIPSERAFQRGIKAFKQQNAQGWLAHTNPDQWRSQYLAASGDAAAHITHPNEEWQMDSTVGDCMLVDPDTGEIRRHHIVAVIDVFTRRSMFLVTRTSKANAIMALIRRAIDAWGMPERIKTDNGSDYVADSLEFALVQLGIGHHLCEPFQPQQKPFVERMFGTLLHSLFPLLTGFIGHSVVQRKAIESAKSFAQRLFGKEAIGQEVELRLTPHQLQTMINNWVDDYLVKKHSTLGVSPAEHTEAHLKTIKRVDSRALDLFLTAVAVNKLCTVRKKGIEIDKGVFTAPELGGIEGSQVRCRMTEDEIGQVYVFDLDGRFICTATDTSRLGIKLQEVSAKRKAKQKQVNDQFKDLLKHAKRAYNTDQAVRDVYLDREQAAIDKATSTGTVRRLPPRETLGTNAAIESALEGMQKEPRRAPSKTAGAQKQAELVQAAMQRLETGTVASVFRVGDSPNARYSMWLRMQQRVSRQEALTRPEQQWFDVYGTGAECRSMHRLHQGNDPLAAIGGQ